MNDFFIAIGLLFIGLITILGAILCVTIPIDYVVCNAYGRATSQEVKFDWGCYVKVDNQWIPKSTVVGKTVIIK